jgi:hypothetical protein
MKTINDLTDEIKAKIPEYISKAKDDLYSGVEAANWKKEDTIVYVNKIYEYCDLKLPVVIVANNPKEYKKFFNHIFNEETNQKFIPMIDELFEKKNNGERIVEMGIEEMLRKEPNVKNEIPAKHDYLFISSEYARVYLMWYRFLYKEFNIPFSKADDLEWFYNHINQASISRCYYTDKVCLVLRMPSRIIRNEIGFHSAEEPAIQFVGGYGVYYLNGRRIPNWVFEKYENKTLNVNDLIKEKNEDIKAGIITLVKEREGNEGLMKFLNATIVDEQEVNHANGYSETLRLWKTKKKFKFLVDKDGNENQPYAWIEMICPSTGQTYLIDTCPSFKDAVACAKWHRPKAVPESVPYVWQSAN